MNGKNFASARSCAAGLASWAMVLSIGATIGASSGALAADPPPARTIRVSGQAVVKATPDRASIAVSVVTRAKTAREASETNARTSKAVLDKLREAVRAPGEVRTAGYDLAPEYDYSQPRGGGQAAALIGYISTNRFAIVTSELAAVGALIDASVASGANQIDSIGFFLDDEQAARRQALLDAGKKARAEAETVAQSLGVELGEVLDASTAANVSPQPMFARDKMMTMEASAPSTEVVPGSLQISASVTVTFAIR